jgi:Arc/MetJ-type ribon-helix-helix transcriptional regulator
MVKVKLTVIILPDLLRWIDEEVKKGHFADRSHAVQYSLLKVQELVKKGEIKF